MKIWIIEIGEPLPLEKNVRLHRYGEFSKFLVSEGAEVTWWASTFSHAPKKHVLTEDSEVDYEGVRLKLLHGPGYKRNVSFQRIKHIRHFAKKFLLAAKKEKVKPDLILSPIPTIETATAVLEYATLHNIPYITDIRDFWPDDFVDLAPVFLRPLVRLLLNGMYRKMRKVCVNAAGIVGIAQNCVDYGLKFAGRKAGENDRVIPHGYRKISQTDDALIEADKFWLNLGVKKEKFIISFIGTLGLFFDIKTVIKVARELQHLPIQFVIAGEGSQLVTYKDLSKDLNNIIYPGWINVPQIASLLNQTKVGLAPYRRHSKMSLPNKPFEYMAYGLPIISSIERDLKGYLEEYDAGISYQADSVEQLRSAVLTYLKSSEKCRISGENASLLFISNFETDIIFHKELEFFKSLLLRTACK
jgi:glycosyltransferase involved in cell wall biosynthesis